MESTEQLFTKIRDDFGETSEEERKIEQLRTIEQGGRTCDEYMQEFKKVARGSGYKGRSLIKEFKRGLNRTIRRKLAEAEEPPMLSRGSECLSDHPRWMFKKNSMEFFVGLQSYLYYCYSGCTLKSHDHLLFLECSMVT